MAAAITFHAGGVNYGTDITGSGLGFFGAGGFGTSVQVGQYQDTTFMTNDNGTIDSGASTNNKYLGNSSGISIDGGSEVQLSGVGLGSGTINVRFTLAGTPITTQSGELRIFNGTDSTVGASGVTTRGAQLINGGSGVDANGNASGTNNGWSAALAGDSVVMRLLASPGSGGLSPSGADTDDERHDWYVCLSASPTEIGSKDDYGLFVRLEYL